MLDIRKMHIETETVALKKRIATMKKTRLLIDLVLFIAWSLMMMMVVNKDNKLMILISCIMIAFSGVGLVESIVKYLDTKTGKPQ